MVECLSARLLNTAMTLKLFAVSVWFRVHGDVLVHDM